MYGQVAPCMLLVYSNPRSGAADELAEWYLEVHGPDSLRSGSFDALHRYEAVGDYQARFLALWEGPFESPDEARAKLVPSARGLRDRSRISSELEVVWSSLAFRSDDRPVDAIGEVVTLTLTEGCVVAGPPGTAYRYGDVALYESADEPDVAAAWWSEHAIEGMAPHGKYRTIFEEPEAWPPPAVPDDRTWASHWRPIASLRKDDL